jgi:3-methylcrotonyl-CoA carboxylase alpha subunit
MTPFQKILIANRGEIASRIIRCCHQMGIQTVAVYSDADGDAPFVSQADEAIRIGPAPSNESYLDSAKVIAAAKASGADAIHPGYGFLAEDAKFARACEEAGIRFIGPRPETIELLASKLVAKKLVGEAGVPVVPSYDLEKPESIQYPIMLKASAGGGGKGMHIVRSAADLSENLESAKRIAQGAFGDDTMLAEQYVESPRHIEIQILGDAQGELVHLFERECSIQRRHQKIIEESPAPGLSRDLRDQIAAAAIAVAKAAKYENAGTVEFIVASTGEFYFLEVNTRLQVEHPITEAVTGIDLVREQIRIAQGESLGYSQDEIQQTGAAIECRLYAEDSEEDFLPCSGVLTDWRAPEVEGLRVDTGVTTNSEISIHYDPLIAKLVCSGDTRAEAIQRMQRTLRGLSTGGLTSNRAFLSRILGHADFIAGKIDTGFLSNHKSELRSVPCSDELLEVSLLAAVCARDLAHNAERELLPKLQPGFRNNRWRSQRFGYRVNEREIWVGYQLDAGGSLQMQVPAAGIALDATAESDAPIRQVQCVSQDGHDFTLDIDGHRRCFRVTNTASGCVVLVDGHELALSELPRFPEAEVEEIRGACTAPMPAKVVKVLVQNGDSVKLGDSLIVLEAMKMEHLIKADAAGLVGDLLVQEGDQVQGGELLVVVAPA